MITRFLWIALLILVPVSQPFAATNEVAGLLPLWTAKGKSNEVHFLGSIHFLKRDYYPLPLPIEKAYTNAAIVVFETDMSRMEDPATIRKIAAEGTYRGDKTIRQDLSSETYKLLKQAAQERFGSPTVFDQMKPYMAAVSLVAVELQRLGFGGKEGVDSYFFTKAEKDKKEVRSLETFEEQMQLFTGLSAKEQEEFLLSALKEMHLFEKIFLEMVDAWKSGNSDQLEQLILQSMKDYPDLMEKFLFRRNRAWVPQLKKLLQTDKDVFVVVGAGHLVGTNNVLQLLQAEGIKVEQRRSK